MTDQLMEENKLRVTKNMYLISAISFCLIAITTYFDNPIYFTQAISALALCTSSLIILSFTKNYKIPVYITVFSSLFIHFIGFLTSSFVGNQGDIYWIIVFTLFSFYTIGKNWSLIYLIFNTLNLVVIKLLTINNTVSLPFESYQPSLASEINFVLNIIACSILFIYLVDQIIKDFETAKENLIRTNKALNYKDIEKSTMLKEIHHRVKNNLQVIISLLRLQLFQLDHNDKVSGPFQDSINRISTMALIHEKMYKGDKINDLSVENYVLELSSDLVRTYATETKIKVDVFSNMDNLKMDDLVPLSLILNELITNSIKHGLISSKTGSILIELSKTSAGFDLNYKDSGIWIENTTDQGFGMELIETLTGHFSGEFERTSDQSGTTYYFNFKLV
ncbi:MAG: sensor histidine kinase [Crocinitomicaceae bacterium]